ncbi:MAG: NAD-dependent epimerase/dehydratase family protein [Chloroflexi bacterium]|nr:NAD-dependent epimerase/dehydratase family protein [Chloroflexota bacterium]
MKLRNAPTALMKSLGYGKASEDDDRVRSAGGAAGQDLLCRLAIATSADTSYNPRSGSHSRRGAFVRILITGVGGFVGAHLVRALAVPEPHAEIHGVYIEPVDSPLVIPHVLDLRDEPSVKRLMDEIRPDQIYHLAGQASVRQALDFPWDTMEHNLRPQLNLTLAMLALEMSPRMLVISSGEVYDSDVAHEKTFTETTPLAPTNPYGVSKVGREMIALQYFRSHGLPMLRVRPFNHFGPGQRGRLRRAGLRDPDRRDRGRTQAAHYLRG